jgi:threonine dehydratase
MRHQNEQHLPELFRRVGSQACSKSKCDAMMGNQPGLGEIEAASRIVYADMPPTPQFCWPLLCDQLGTEIWVKHENQTPVGAFKIRGGLTYFAHLAKSGTRPGGVISATRGNHGQSIGFAARRYDIPATVVVPKGNSVEKNAAMRALGVELIEQGDDFQDSLEFATDLASERSLHLVPSFHHKLVAGVATYSLELFRAVNDIDVAYVPIGLGSGICGMIAVRDALKLKTRIVGVVSAHATAYAQSFAAGRLIESPVSTQLADGMACRTPQPDALAIILDGVERIVRVSDEEVACAMRTLFECTHNTCEGAGAASLAAAVQEGNRISGQKVAVVASGGNVDRDVFAAVLADQKETI